jgi:hypothetical protein
MKEINKVIHKNKKEWLQRVQSAKAHNTFNTNQSTINE